MSLEVVVCFENKNKKKKLNTSNESSFGLTQHTHSLSLHTTHTLCLVVCRFFLKKKQNFFYFRCALVGNQPVSLVFGDVSFFLFFYFYRCTLLLLLLLRFFGLSVDNELNFLFFF